MNLGHAMCRVHTPFADTPCAFARAYAKETWHRSCVILPSMRLRRLFPTLGAAVLLQLLSAGPLAAQDTITPARFIPAALVAASALAPAAPSPFAPLRTQALQKQLRRGRALITAGTGLIAAGVAHAAAFGRRGSCHEDHGRLILPSITGSIVAVAGLGMTWSGGLKVAGVPVEFRRANPLTSKTVPGVLFGAIGTALVSSVTLFGIAALPWIECISS